MGANSNDFHIAKMHTTAARWQFLFNFLTKIFTMLLIGFCVWNLFEFLKIACITKPETLSQIAIIIEKFKLHVVTSGLVSLGLFGWGVSQRQQRNRAIEKLDEFRKLAEQGDSQRAGSGLTKKGGTPKAKK